MPTISGNVEILLKPHGSTKREVPRGIGDVIQSEYASKYLELIGVNPTRENVELVNRNLPINDCLILGVWARGSLLVLPGMAKKTKEGPNILKELFGIHDEEEDAFNVFADKANATNLNLNLGTNALTIEEENEAARLANITDKYTYIQSNNRKASMWTSNITSQIMSPLDKQLPSILLSTSDFQDLLKPPILDDTHIGKPLFTFSKSLLDYVPRIKEDRSGAAYESIKKFLQTSQCIKLYGALVHYIYWNAIRKFVSDIAEIAGDERFLSGIGDELDCKQPSSPSSSPSYSTSIEKELLHILLEKAMLKLKTSLGYSKFSLVTGHQSFICSCHFVVDQLLDFCFPFFVSMEKRLQQKHRNPSIRVFGIEKEMDVLRFECRKVLHKFIVDVVDPSRIYTATNTLICSFLGTNKDGGKIQKANQFTISLGVKEVFSEYAQDAFTRKLMSHTREKVRRLPILNKEDASIIASSASAFSTLAMSPNATTRNNNMNVLSTKDISSPNADLTDHIVGTSDSQRQTVSTSVSAISSDKEYYSSDIKSSSSSISKSGENRPMTVRFNLIESESNSNPAATYFPSTTIPSDLRSPIRAKYSSGPKGDLLASLKAVRSKSHIDWYDRSSTSKQCNPKETSQRVSAYLGIAPEPEPAKPAHAPPLDFKNLFKSSLDKDEANNNSLSNDGNNFSNNSSSSFNSIANAKSSPKKLGTTLSSSSSFSSNISCAEKSELFQLIVKRAQSSYESNGNGGLPADRNRFSLLNPGKQYK